MPCCVISVTRYTARQLHHGRSRTISPSRTRCKSGLTYACMALCVRCPTGDMSCRCPPEVARHPTAHTIGSVAKGVVSPSIALPDMGVHTYRGHFSPAVGMSCYRGPTNWHKAIVCVSALHNMNNMNNMRTVDPTANCEHCCSESSAVQ
jgi:hypothetical protein